MKKIYPFLISQFLFFSSFAQSFGPEILGSAGAFSSSSSGSMAWTIGEVMTETYSSSNNFFTQGFHQPDTSIIINVNSFSNGKISVYPNPSAENIFLDFSGHPGNYFVEIFDMKGQLVFFDKTQFNQKQIKISLTKFSNGVYLLNLTNSESNFHNSYKIIKEE